MQIICYIFSDKYQVKIKLSEAQQNPISSQSTAHIRYKKMLNINQKYICAYNQKTSLHYIVSIDVQGYTLALPPVMYGHQYRKYYQKGKGNVSVKGINMSINKMGKMHQQSWQQQDQEQVDNVDNELHQYLARQKRQSKNDKQHQYVNFKQIFVKFNIDIDLCVKKQFYIAQLDKYCQFQQITGIPNCLPIQILDLSIIIIKFVYIQAENIEQNYQNNNIEHNYTNWKQHFLKKITTPNKNPIISYPNPHPQPQQQQNKWQFDQTKQRDRSRSIGQIIQFVKKWRFLADQGINGKKLNLQQAALYVGIPKKSLDDYFYQLRVAEKFQFDFQGNLDQNISFLRKFVKQKLPRRNKKISKNSPSNKAEHEGSQYDNKQQQIQFKLPKTLKQPLLTKSTSQSHIYQHNNNNKIKQNLPSNTKLNTTSQQQQHQHQQQNQSYRFCKFSDSDVSSLNIWPNANNINKDQHNIFDDQDSFFNDFKLGVDSFMGYQHLIKGDQGYQQRNSQ